MNERWKVIADNGAFYTLEKDDYKLDFMKLDVATNLQVGEYVEVLNKDGLRTIV